MDSRIAQLNKLHHISEKVYLDYIRHKRYTDKSYKPEVYNPDEFVITNQTIHAALISVITPKSTAMFSMEEFTMPLDDYQRLTNTTL